MKALLHSELRKFRYQRSTYGILLAAMALSAISSASIVAASQQPGNEQFGFALNTELGMNLVIASAAASYIFALVLGIVSITTEFRHSTAVATYLAQPHRRNVMLVKMALAAVGGALLQFISTAFGMAVGTTYVQQYEHLAVPFDTYTRVMAGAVLVGAVLGVMGVAVGSLIRSQMVAITIALLWLQLVEGLLIVFADWIGKYSIRGAITSVLDIAVRVHSPGLDLDTTQGLGPWQSVALLLVYAAILGTVATVTSMRRDVD